MQPTLPHTATVPTALRDVDQWVCWRTRNRGGEKSTKVPIDSATGSFASTTDPTTWTSYDDAFRAAQQRGATGLGFVFTADDAFVGVDLDHCRDPETGTFEPWAAELVGQLDSYTEVSPSGTGCHVLCRGTMPPGRNRSGDVEMYTESRFFTVTGDHVAGTPLTVEHRTAVLGAIATAHLSTSETTPTESEAESESGSEVTTETSASSTVSTLSDDDLLERAKAAANGEKFTRLWSGDVSTYDSHSEADMALCCLLAFWTGGDTNRMNQLFCRSGLYRGKWDEQHFADGSTYGERTLQRACERTTEHYTPTPTDTNSTPTAARPGQSPTPRPSVPTAKVVHRLTTTEETLEYLEARVSTVEQECERLRDELAVAREPTPTTDQRTNTDSKAGVLARVGRLFR